MTVTAVPGPMLAEVYDDVARSRMTWPVYVQPKLAGVRCRRVGGRWESRTGKDSLKVPPDIGRLLDRVAPGLDLDGELYVQGWSEAKIAAAARMGEPLLEYWIFDLIDARRPFEARWHDLMDLIYALGGSTRARVVCTRLANGRMDVEREFCGAMAAGAEGLILRGPKAVYTAGRTAAVLKYKPWIDCEARVIDLETAGESGLVTGLRVEGVDDTWRQTVYLGITDEQRAEWFDHPDRILGRLVTLRYNGRTPDGRPIRPTLAGLRHDIDL